MKPHHRGNGREQVVRALRQVAAETGELEPFLVSRDDAVPDKKGETLDPEVAAEFAALEDRVCLEQPREPRVDLEALWERGIRALEDGPKS